MNRRCPHCDFVVVDQPGTDANSIFMAHIDGHTNRRSKWDRRFLALAEHIAGWSKDPSTKVGAVIVAPNRSVVSVGFNGFARGVDDTAERYADRDMKYKLIVHAEQNAITFARRDLTGHTLYTWPFMPCSVCAGVVIQTGISRCVAPTTPSHLRGRWDDDMALATRQFSEAGVDLSLIDPLP